MESVPLAAPFTRPEERMPPSISTADGTSPSHVEQDASIFTDALASYEGLSANYVHQVIDQACMAADGYASARRAQVGFGGHGILAVAEIVADIGKKLHERDSEIRRVALAPFRCNG